ncbi:unnamed protein product [Thlaspi arvense]|uniref:NFD4 C-terminal domain-containing protein n=1 Tax=Thlaspi arvense TaxID=13288 RepID=A0AAU9RMX5_THLAR|nr:unnamed protein product [Thlaspi arvense]
MAIMVFQGHKGSAGPSKEPIIQLVDSDSPRDEAVHPAESDNQSTGTKQSSVGKSSTVMSRRYVTRKRIVPAAVLRHLLTDAQERYVSFSSCPILEERLIEFAEEHKGIESLVVDAGLRSILSLVQPYAKDVVHEFYIHLSFAKHVDDVAAVWVCGHETMLYKVCNAIPIDFRKVVFDQVVYQSRFGDKKWNLVFPSIIYKLLLREAPIVQDHEILLTPILTYKRVATMATTKQETAQAVKKECSRPEVSTSTAAGSKTFTLSNFYFARTGWLTIALLPSTIALFLLASSGSLSALQAGTTLIGLSSGFIFAAAVSITSELFGPNSVGVNHNILTINVPIGSLVYGFLAALVYESHSMAGSNTQSVIYMGRDCYHLTFLWWGCLSVIGLASSF